MPGQANAFSQSDNDDSADTVQRKISLNRLQVGVCVCVSITSNFGHNVYIL